MKIVYKSKFYCKFCKKEIPISVHGEGDFIGDNETEREVKEWGEHYHWIEKHQNCTLCGKLVQGEDLELLIDDGKIRISDNYNGESYLGNKTGLLTVHKKCIEKNGKRILWNDN